MLKYNLGILGGGINSAVGRAHVSAARMDGRWNIIAGCFSKDSAENVASAKAYGIRACFAEELFHPSRVFDAVAILTPTPQHYWEALEFLTSELPVICEKSLVETSEQARHLQAQGGFLAVVYNYSGYPMVRAMRKIIQDGALGKLTHFAFEYPLEGFALQGAAPQEWRKHDAAIPTIHLDLTVHLHHLLRYVAGIHPESVSAVERKLTPFGIVDDCSALIRCSNDIAGQLWVSKASLGNSNGMRLRVYGTEGSLEWYQQHPDELRFALNDQHGANLILGRGDPIVPPGRFKPGHPTGFVEALATLYCDFADCLTQYKAEEVWDSEEVFGADLAEEGLRFCEALHLSAQTERWEKV